MSDVPPPPASGPPSVPPPPPPPPPSLVQHAPSASAPPPGYVAYGNSPTPTGALRRVRGVALAVVILTGVAATCSILATLLAAGVTQDAKNYLNGELSDEDFRNAIAPVSTMQIAAGVATIATFVLTAIWMFRLASNIRAFQRRTTWSPLFGIFGWMLPPGFLYVIPFLMLRELWKASDPRSPTDSESWRTSGESPLVWAWFVTYGLLPIVLAFFTVGALLSGGLTDNTLESTAESLDSFGPLNIVAVVATAVSGVLWILFVRKLTARHSQLTNER